jgi:hypothetical protein
VGLEIRKVSGSSINLFGTKHQNPKLKEYNGQDVLIATAKENEQDYYIVVLSVKHELVCVIKQ